MSDTKNQVLSFIDKCEEVCSSKFIMASTRIKDLLKCIVSSSDLYLLFKEVTANFDYIAAKQRCLITYSNGIFTKNYIVLPQTAGECLAFIFCLLVEFDRDTLNFNSFLQKYYSEDGSYYASYQEFCKQIIVPLENLIKAVFEEELTQAELPAEDSAEATGEHPEDFEKALSLLEGATVQEKNIIAASALSEEEKQIGYVMLNELILAYRANNYRLTGALLSGYNYYCVCNGVGTGMSSLITAMGNLENFA